MDFDGGNMKLTALISQLEAECCQYPPEAEGYYRLCEAMLERAIRDLSGPPIEPRHRQNAISWFRGRYPDHVTPPGLTFHFVCETLNIDPKKVLKVLNQHMLFLSTVKIKQCGKGINIKIEEQADSPQSSNETDLNTFNGENTPEKSEG